VSLKGVYRKFCDGGVLICATLSNTNSKCPVGKRRTASSIVLTMRVLRSDYGFRSGFALRGGEFVLDESRFGFRRICVDCRDLCPPPSKVFPQKTDFMHALFPIGWADGGLRVGDKQTRSICYPRRSLRVCVASGQDDHHRCSPKTP